MDKVTTIIIQIGGFFDFWRFFSHYFICLTPVSDLLLSTKRKIPFTIFISSKGYPFLSEKQ